MLHLIDPNSRTLYERYKSKLPFENNQKKEKNLAEKDKNEIGNLEIIEQKIEK